jgi:hypothetical protein
LSLVFSELFITIFLFRSDRGFSGKSGYFGLFGDVRVGLWSSVRKKAADVGK